MSVQLNFAARSDVGLVRSSNQDSGYAGAHLLVVADGMGGPAGGDIASSVAVAHLAPLDDDVHPAGRLVPLLRGAVDAAHEELMERSGEDSALAGLGTTVVALLRSGNKLGMVHIGDSRAYLLRDGQLVQVTTDHTYVNHLVQTGRITPEQAERHPHRNMILRALGDNEGEVILDESIREALAGDRWLLCSDGLHGMVAGDTIAETLAGIPDPGACADRLVDLALRAGGVDNVTVVIADVMSIEDIDRDHLPHTSPQVVGAAATDRLRHSRAVGGDAPSASSAAARAAALAPRPPVEEEEPPPPRRRRPWGLIAGVLLIIALAVGGGALGYRWTQTQYFVATERGNVAIFQGIPQELGPLTFATLHERTDVVVAELSGFARDRLQHPITRGSLAEAQLVVDNLRGSVPAAVPTGAPVPTETAIPSPTAPEGP